MFPPDKMSSCCVVAAFVWIMRRRVPGAFFARCTRAMNGNLHLACCIALAILALLLVAYVRGRPTSEGMAVPANPGNPEPYEYNHFLRQV